MKTIQFIGLAQSPIDGERSELFATRAGVFPRATIEALGLRIPDEELQKAVDAKHHWNNADCDDHLNRWSFSRAE